MPDKLDTLYWAARLGRTLRDRRKSLGLSLEDLSRLSGPTVPTLSHIERGKRDVKLSTLITLTKALRIEMPDLFIEKDKPPDTPNAEQGTSGYDLDDD